MKNLQIIGIVLLVIFIIILFSSFKSIPTGFVGVKTQFGAVQETIMQEGLNLKTPFIEQINLIDCRIQVAEVDTGAASKDSQTVQTKVSVNYRINKESANNLYKEIGLNYKNIIIDPALLDSIKSSTAKFTAEEAITKRDELANKIKETLEGKMKEKGITIVEINVPNVDFSPEYNKAIESKQVIEQQTKAAQYELEKAKIENEKKIVQAEADAKVMALQSAQITDKTLELERIKNQKAFIDKWTGTLPTTTLSEGLGLFNLNK